MKAKIMKTKEEILKEAYLDIMYTTKNSKEILENVYEYGFANGFKQGNDNAREVADFEKKKKALQNLNMTREEVQGPPQEEKQVSLTHEPPFDENPSDREIIEALILHLNEQDGFLTAINCVSTKAILSWLKKQKEQKPAEWSMEDKQNQMINLDHFKSYMLQYLQDAANRKDDSEIEKDTDIWAKKLLNLINIDI